MNRLYIGIDPGKTGALAIIDGENVSVYPFDELLYQHELKIASHIPAVCCLEHVGAKPGNGKVAMFNFGDNFGFCRGLLTAFEIPYELVRPQKWKKEFGISDKNQSIAVCKRLFPGVDLRPSERCKKDSDDMAEALLLALYAKRRL